MGNFKKKIALFWDILSTQEAKFQIWYLSEFLVVLWPKYIILNKTTLGIHKNGQIIFFCKNPHWIVCANLMNLQKNDEHTVFEVYLTLTMPLNYVFMQPSMANLNSPSSRVVKDSTPFRRRILRCKNFGKGES